MQIVSIELPTFEEIEAALASDAPQRWGTASRRGITIAVEPSSAAIWLLCPVGSGAKPLPSPTNVIEISLAHIEGEHFYQVGSRTPSLRREVYYFICGLVCRAEESEEDIADVIDGEIAAWSALLRAPSAMDRNQQTGLLGELWVLWRILKNAGPGAIAGWTGPASEQHDFRLEQEDLEVKTTLAHSRDHTINGLGQLRVASARPLSIVSIQLKPAGAGPGASLAGAVHQFSEALSGRPDVLTKLMTKLLAIGYRRTEEHLYSDRYCLRSTPSLIAVDEKFPRITSEAIAEMLPDESARRIRQVVYMVNLDGMGNELDNSCPMTALRPGEWEDLYA